MRKIAAFLDERVLKIGVGFLLIFIPLWPKLPLLDLKHTWVYIRVEDFLVAGLVLIWGVKLLQKKISLKTPLTRPIILYWLAGGVSTLFAILVLGKSMTDFFPQLAILHYLRRIEYMVLFFMAFSSVKKIQDIYHYLAVLGVTAITIVFYGFGQKLMGFPAFLTMNEEFAKGKPLYLPPWARITSTFGGHYDLAAYLVLTIAIFVSLIFAVSSKRAKISWFLIALASFILLLLTASRVSFMVYLISVSLVLFWQNKKLLIIPFAVLSLLVMQFVSGTSTRFFKTFRIKDVVYNLHTGEAVGTIEKITQDEKGKEQIVLEKDPSPAKESLPPGSGYISLPVAPPPKPTTKTITVMTAKSLEATDTGKIATISGSFAIQKVLVYDISFTTRFQGEWPRALEAFNRSRLLGSGYSSISLATDNDYLRLLGETGILGFLTFALIIAVFSIWIHLALKKIRQPLIRALALGSAGGLAGLLLNALLIDVFEASKLAFSLWLILGIAVGGVSLYYKEKINFAQEAKNLIRLPIVWAAALFVLTFILNGKFLNNYFVGDDYTWLRWAAQDNFANVFYYFVDASGFFYRPLQKLFYFVLYAIFWLKPAGYHLTSLFIHFLTASIWFLFLLKITKNQLLAAISSLIFLVYSIHGESIFWISTLGHTFSSLLVLLSLYSFWVFRSEGRRRFYLYALFMAGYAMMAYEGGIAAPVLILWLDIILGRGRKKRFLDHLPLLLLIPLYIAVRNMAGAHGLSGDYNYNLKALPFNLTGNLFGYAGLTIFGPNFFSFYTALRFYGQNNIEKILLVLIEFAFLFFSLFLALRKKVKVSRLVVFGLGFFALALLPFLGLGNAAERYVYLASTALSLLTGLLLINIYQKVGLRGKMIGYLVLTLLSLGIVNYYQSDLNKSGEDWRKAGEETRKIVLTLKKNFVDQDYENMAFIFVNPPIKKGRAWVFPVGLEDALWHGFRSETLKIEIYHDTDTALDAKPGIPASHVFDFDNGLIRELERTTKTVPINAD